MTVGYILYNLISLTLSAHVREGYSSRLVCLSVRLQCTTDLEGRCITMVQTGTNVKKKMIFLSSFDVPLFFFLNPSGHTH